MEKGWLTRSVASSFVWATQAGASNAAHARKKEERSISVHLLSKGTQKASRCSLGSSSGLFSGLETGTRAERREGFGGLEEARERPGRQYDEPNRNPIGLIAPSRTETR